MKYNKETVFWGVVVISLEFSGKCERDLYDQIQDVGMFW